MLAAAALVGGLVVLAVAPARAAAGPARAPTTTVPGVGLAPLPSLSATASGATSAGASSGSGSPGFFDIGGRVRAAITDWFRDLVTSALAPALDLLGRSVLATPEVTGAGRVRELWAASAGMAGGFFVLLALAGAVVVMGHETVQTRYSLKDIAPRLVVAVVAAGASLAVAGTGITLANALSRALLGSGGEADAARRLSALVTDPLGAGGIFVVLVALVAAVLAVVLVVSYLARVAVVVVLVAGAPLALACHALPQTEALALGWWRALGACLGVQVAQSLVLVAALRVFVTGDGASLLGLGSGGLVDVLVVVCLLWILARVPVWAARAVFSGRRSTVVSVARTYALARAARAAAA